MGRKSGISGRGYHPKIWRMNLVLDARRQMVEAVEAQEYVTHKAQMMELGAIRCNELIALEVLRQSDEGFDEWYDNDANVPAFGTREERTALMRERVIEVVGKFPTIHKEIYNDVYIFSDETSAFFFSKELGVDKFHWIEFDSIENAKAFIDGLKLDNLGFGWVLDVLPKNEGVM